MARDNDNTLTQANDLGAFPGSNSVNRKGNVNPIDDRSDFYRVNVSAPTRFVAALTPKTAGADFSLFDGSGNRIKGITRFASDITPRILDSDNLLPGVYFLEVRAAGGSTDYDLGINGSRITSAELGVTVNRITALGQFDFKLPFSSSFRADFLSKITIDRQTRASGVFDKDSNDVRPNFTFKKSVPFDKRFLDIRIEVEDEDPGLNDFADISPASASGFAQDLELNFDARNGTFFDTILAREGNQTISSEGFIITSRGGGGKPPDTTGFDVHNAQIEYRVDYNTFTAASTALQSAPMIVGSGTDITGRNIGGILVGNDRHNNISAKGGNDALCGGKGKDLLDGGTGNDIAYGGDGKDIHIGGMGRDIFVVDLDSQSVDLFQDFQINRDRIGLPLALHPDMIDIVDHRSGTALKLGTDTLAVLQGIKPNQIDANDFVQVDLATIRGVEVPYVTAMAI